jgi:adenosine deaminase
VSTPLDITALPKAELHLHLEGTLEPELAVQLARRNGIESLAGADPDVLRARYEFSDLQEFLDIYYEMCDVLREPADFAALTEAYLTRAAADGVTHAEMFFDPQSHTHRGIPFDDLMAGLTSVTRTSQERFGITTSLIMCVVRHLPVSDAVATVEQALSHKADLVAIGLDSTEIGNAAIKYKDAFDLARSEGLRVTAHAGEEGDPSYVWGVLDDLGAERVDHGVRSLEDATLVKRLVADQIPLTMCPQSNVRLKVVPDLSAHPLKKALDLGLLVCVNSDDPAYFGGYVGDNYRGVTDALGLDDATVRQLAANSFRASFLPDAEKALRISGIDAG